jgi:nitrogen fixation protein FixH
VNLSARPVQRTGGLRGGHVATLFLAFFGIVVAVNGAMIYSALSTHTGLVAIEPYRKGLHYNNRIAADERQARLGWAMTTLDVRADGRILLRLAESDGRPVRGLQVQAVLARPSTNRHDVALMLREEEPGAYAATTPRLSEGSWLLGIEATQDGHTEPVFRARRRLWLKP